MGRGCRYKNDDNLKSKALPIDLTFTTPRGNTFLDRSARWSGHAIREAASAKKNKYRGLLSAFSRHLRPPAIATCGEIGHGAQRLNSALAEESVHHCRHAEDEEGQKVAVGRYVRYSRVLGDLLLIGLRQKHESKLIQRTAHDGVGRVVIDEGLAHAAQNLMLVDAKPNTYKTP